MHKTKISLQLWRDDGYYLTSPQKPIAIVDDDQDLHEILEFVFEESTLPNPLRLFQSGQEFLEYIDNATGETPFDLALIDINMPNKNGFEVLSELRARETVTNRLSVCMLSGSESPRDIDRAKTLGADGYLVKPCDLNDFIALFSSLNVKNKNP